MDMVADEVMQLGAFARTIETGEGREWMHSSALATWVLMGGVQRVGAQGGGWDVKAMHASLLGA